MAFYSKYGTINVTHRSLKIHQIFGAPGGPWTVFQLNEKMFMIVVSIVSLHKIHIWSFMVGKFRRKDERSFIQFQNKIKPRCRTKLYISPTNTKCFFLNLHQ